MKRIQDIVIFGDDWGRYPSTIQHIGQALQQQGYRILWVGSLALRQPEFTLADVKRIIEKMQQMHAPIYSKDTEAFHSVSPFIIPFHDIPLVRFINAKIVAFQLKKELKKIGFENFIVLSNSPVTANFIDSLGSEEIHYICLDDFTQFKGAFKCLAKMEEQLVQKVKTVFGVSDILLQTRIPASGRRYFLPQGVNIDKYIEFRRHLQHHKSEEKVIGYFGLIADYVDVELICRCAGEFPTNRFVIIGKTTVNVDVFSQYANIEYIGPIPYDELPEQATQFDIGIIPFRVNELTIACNPLKLLEYFALGLPVVSTNLPEVKKFAPLVDVAIDETDFVELLRNRIFAVEDKDVEQRCETAENYTWEKITTTMLKQIEEGMGPTVQ